MSRRALIDRIERVFFRIEPGPAARWCWLGAAVAAGIALAGLAAGQRARTGSPVQRQLHVAARVQCPAVGCAAVESLALDVWSEQRGPGMPLDIVIERRSFARLGALGASWEILVPDVDAAIAEETARLHRPAAARPADWFAEYRDFTAITARLRELAEIAPDRASLHAIGASIEGRPLWAVRIGPTGAAADAALPMLIDGTQHAREWISAMVATCVADRLVRDGGRDPAIRSFVEHTALWVVPVVNPDGYQYSWSGSRLWRKNRRGGFGVDLNRNFAVAWGGTGSSGQRGASNYRGEYPFSEPETAALRDLVKRERIAMHIDFHAYGQLVLYPWGYTGTPTRDRDRYAAIGDRMASALYAAHGTAYKLMQAVELYPASGDMSDWVYGEADALSYTIELRPSGGLGFILPPEQIRPTCDEGLAAVLALRDAMPSDSR